MEFCKCGSIKVNGSCTNNQCPEKDNKLKGWVVDGMSLDFKRPVTHDEAVKAAKRLKDAKNKNMKL